MKKVLITGATGYIGGALLNGLLKDGYSVQALIRDSGKGALLPPEVRLFKGDLFETGVLEQAMRGVEEVYHVAAFARPWAPDVSTFNRINVEGTENVLKAAAKMNVRRVVFTSTAGVFGPSLDGGPVNEAQEHRGLIHTEYDRSKSRAEAIIQKRVGEGQDIVIVNPSRVYGPGPLALDNGVTKMIRLHLTGKFRVLPGDGNSMGNYVFIEDVVKGHMLAMAHGIAGERYALGGENASFREFFEKLSRVSGIHYRMFTIPQVLMRVSAEFMQLRANWFGIPPVITPEWVGRFSEHRALSSDKAEQQLGYAPRTLEAGLHQTVQWLKQAG